MISVIKSKTCCENFVIRSVKIDSSVRENVSLKDHLILLLTEKKSFCVLYDCVRRRYF